MELQGGDKLEKALADIGKRMTGSVEVGFLEDARYPDGTPMAPVAFWNEFGTSTIPARPFFRTAISEKSGEWASNLGKAAKNYQYDGETVMEFMGETMKQDIQQSMNGWTEPANAPSTEKRKGFNKPLKHTGALQDDGVDFRVNP